MKNIVLILLIAMVPFSTMAQKRSKKGKNVKTEKIVESNLSYDFMIITGYEMAIKAEARNGGDGVARPATTKEMMKPNSNLKIVFDFGRVKSNAISNLLRNAEEYRTMAHAVNAAIKEGWDFISSDVIISGNNRTHYYYMKRNN